MKSFLSANLSKFRFDRTKALLWLLAAGVLFGSFLIRSQTFWLPHWKGDQSQYVALAMKLASGGLDTYNLREINLYPYRFPDGPKIIYPVHDSPGEAGDILDVLKMIGQGYYDEPLHMRAPLFPYALAMSHRLLADSDQPFVVRMLGLGEEVLPERSKAVFHAQMWAVIVPLFFGLALIVLMLIWGRVFFGWGIALTAAFLLATNPMSVMASQRLWTEEMLAFLVALSLFLFVYSLPKKNTWGLFAAGCMGGLAILTKQTAGIIFFVVWIYAFLNDGKKDWTWKTFYKRIFMKEVIIYVSAALLVSGYWFLRVTETYGNPLHTPVSGMSLAQGEDVSGWFAVLSQRPSPAIFFAGSPIWLSPIFLLVFVSLVKLPKTVNDVWAGRSRDQHLLFFWVWILVYYALVAQPWNVFAHYNQECRFFYPAYPAMIFLVCFTLKEFRDIVNRTCGRSWVGEAAVAALLIASTMWSLWLGLSRVFQNSVLL